MSKTKLDAALAYELAPEIEILAESPDFNSSERLAFAGRIAMAKHVRKLYKHLPGALTGHDPHDIHQMRVATRRLRACLASTEVAYQPKIVQNLRKRLRKLARVLGEVRDRDVMLLRLRDDAAKLPPDETTALQQVIDRLQAEREAAHTELVAELGRKRTARLLHDLTMFLTRPIEDVQADDGGLPLLVRHHAGSTIWREYEAIRRFETVMPHAAAERLHELRISCKHLRYTLELFEPALGSEAAHLIKLVTEMQEHLGALHDADVASAYLGVQHNQHEQLADAPAGTGTDEAMPPDAEETPHHGDFGAYLAARASERRTLLSGVEPLWEQISGDQTRRAFGELLAGL